jgi:hypothetical protein
MGYYDTINAMYSEAKKQNKYNFPACVGIINAIMNYYMISTNFYFNDCINTFQRFLNTGILNFNN